MDYFVLALMFYLSVGTFFYLCGLVVLVSEFFQADSQFNHLQTMGMMLLLNFVSMVLLIIWPQAVFKMIRETKSNNEIEKVKGWCKSENTSFLLKSFNLSRSLSLVGKCSVRKASGLALISGSAFLMTMVLE